MMENEIPKFCGARFFNDRTSMAVSTTTSPASRSDHAWPWTSIINFNQKDEAAQVELNALELLLIPHPRRFNLIPEGNTSHLNYLAILGYSIQVRHSSQDISDVTSWG